MNQATIFIGTRECRSTSSKAKPTRVLRNSGGGSKEGRFGAMEVLRDRHRPASATGGSSERLPSGGRFNSRLAGFFPGSASAAFGPKGPSRGASGSFGSPLSQARKFPRKGKGTRRKNADGSTSGPSAGHPSRGGYGPSAKRPSLNRGGPKRSRPEARSLSNAVELRLRRRRECPARTRSVGSRLRS